jgi:hypothetical protein
VDKGFVPSPRIVLWTDDWASGQFSWDAIGYEADERKLGRDFRYLGPCFTPAEVDARVQQARRDALVESATRASNYAVNAHQHGSLPVDPHQCAKQVAWEITASIIAMAEGEKDGDAPNEAALREMMRDPRYWRKRDPEWVKRVTEGFRRLVGAKKGEGDE